MDEQNDPQEEQPEEIKVVEGDQATILLSLEELIKNNIAAIDKISDELKKHREMFEDGFNNNSTYMEHTEKAKEAAKVKAETKKQIMQQPAVRALGEKIKGLAAEVKERKTSLSDYLLEYQRLSGFNEIEALDGTMREIVNEAKLIKRVSKGE